MVKVKPNRAERITAKHKPYSRASGKLGPCRGNLCVPRFELVEIVFSQRPRVSPAECMWMEEPQEPAGSRDTHRTLAPGTTLPGWGGGRRNRSLEMWRWSEPRRVREKRLPRAHCCPQDHLPPANLFRCCPSVFLWDKRTQLRLGQRRMQGKGREYLEQE